MGTDAFVKEMDEAFRREHMPNSEAYRATFSRKPESIGPVGGIALFAVCAVAAVGALWAAISAVRWLWNNPLF